MKALQFAEVMGWDVEKDGWSMSVFLRLGAKRGLRGVGAGAGDLAGSTGT